MKKTTKKPGMPFADSAIAKYIDKKIDELKGVKTQREIAQEAGYETPNIISMLKRGESKVPLEKIPLLAKALGVDPAHMFRLALEQYWPDRSEIIAKLFGRLASENEEEIFLKHWRAATCSRRSRCSSTAWITSSPMASIATGQRVRSVSQR